MANEPMKIIKVKEDSSLTKLLTEAAVRPILLEKNGEVFLLERMENDPKTPSPEEVIRSFRNKNKRFVLFLKNDKKNYIVGNLSAMPPFLPHVFIAEP